MKICIVNDVPPSANPRTRKEADSLAAAGHEVTVVSASYSAEMDAADAVTGRARLWTHHTVNYRHDTVAGLLRSVVSRARVEAHRGLARLWMSNGVAERAFVRFAEGFRAVLAGENADLYLAHNLPSLPLAARAARERGAMLGFDIEDYHLDEDSDDTRDALGVELKTYLMRKYLPRCDYSSATSEAMADAIVRALPVARPLVIYNVFPLWEAGGVPAPADRRRAPGAPATGYSAYWFSQVIGLDRGLQDVIRALARLRVRVDMHCRGRISEPTRRALMDLADSLGVASQLHFHAPVHFTKLAAEAARFDLGLAVEQPLNVNKQVTASNKLFVYLLSGLAPVVTDVPGQREVMDAVGECGVVYAPGDVDGLARGIDRLLEEPARLLAARERAWNAARQRFCWDVEEKKLLSAIQALATGTPARARTTARPRRAQVPFDVPILMYHDIRAVRREGARAAYEISLAAFERQLDLLTAHRYRVIGFPELFGLLDGDGERTGREVVLTFDDGYESFARLAVPALVKRGMIATTFVVAAEIGGHNRWDDARPATPHRRLMDPDAIRGVIAAGMAIGSHGWSHRNLTHASPADAEAEIVRSRQALRERFAIDADVFSYPFGAHSAAHHRVVERAGYRGAVAIFSPGRHVTSNRYAMRRVYVHAGDGALRFRAKLSPAYLRLRAWRDARTQTDARG